MADLPALLAVLEHDPDDAQALASLSSGVAGGASRLDAAKKTFAQRGRPDTVVALIDAELGASPDLDRRVDLLLEKGMILDGELLDPAAARATFAQVLALRPNDEMAKDAIGELDVAQKNWEKFAAKYVSEAQQSTDRSLATGLFLSAAEIFARFAPDAAEGEQYLRRALEIDPKNAKAAFHLARKLRAASRWKDLAALYEHRAESGDKPEQISSLLSLADVQKQLGESPDATLARVLALDPASPRALRARADALAHAGDWRGLVGAYQAALKARREEDPGILLQIAMVAWRHLGDTELAEEYFRRLRKLDPAHPAAIDFYREYYPAKGEHQKLMALLRQVEKSPRSNAGRPIGVEIAELAEAQGNSEKAIEAWKQLQRSEPADSKHAADARTALARLYRRTEKWNALLDLMKDEIERLPPEGRIERLFDVVEIYRDKLRLDVMVINTYKSILALDPENRRASEELATKFRALGRWNDLIAVLATKSEAAETPLPERIALLRESADLWAERFGNFANAIKPLERIVELSPTDADALARLKDIYTKRRQWRALIDLLAREAGVLRGDEKRGKQAEMARLAAERLGDTRLAIEIYNGMLGDAPGPALVEVLAALASLYEREKRYLALAEILHRQRAAASGKDAIALLEKLGQVYAERLAAPQQAAEAWQDVLAIEPGHARALRTLRELYATAGDFAGLERLYAKLGQEEELVDALLGIADRIEAKAQRLPLVERAAQLAQQRADAGAPALVEKARQVWERVLAVEPTHVGAAQALVPIYGKQEKWARLIQMHEIELAAAPDVKARLAKLAEIRALCEQKLVSKKLAFQWTLRAFDLDPASEALYGDVLRLATDADDWRDVAALFERHAQGNVPAAVKLRLHREVARLSARRLGDLERARTHHRAVLGHAPDDREAETHLEELAIQLADWPELLASYRRRAAREPDPTERAGLLGDIASLQEEKLVDLDAASTTYKEALAVLPGQLRAVRALARIEEARGDWESLANVLAIELQQTTEPPARAELLMRLGQLEETSLERPGRALGHYRDALAAGHGRAVSSVARLVLPPRATTNRGAGVAAGIAPADQVAAARTILPHLEAARAGDAHAAALEVIRGGEHTAPAERLDLDRQLLRLYHVDLGDHAAAWQTGLRVVAADPADADVRSALGALAGQLGRDGEWAQHLGGALANLRAKSGPPGEIRAVATELAKLAGDRLGDRVTAERAWLGVLDVEAHAPDAFEALAAMYRADGRFTDLRALLERRAEVSLEDGVRKASLLELAALEEDVLGEPAAAVGAYRRVLELDPGYSPAYLALDRLYAAAAQWPELEALLARQVEQFSASPYGDAARPGRAGPVEHAKTPRELVELSYRRAELFAHRLGDQGRAVDLLEDVIARQRGHADGRELLEELLATPGVKPDVQLRVARLLEPLYEQDKLWKDLVGVLRAQRALASGTEAVELLSRIATIEEAELGGAPRAFEAWAQVLALDPTHERARVELVRLAQQLDRWPDATAALEAAAVAAPAGDVATRAALLGELAAYYDNEAGDTASAIAAYRRLLDADPSSPANVRRAGAALARLYEGAGNWAELRAVTRRQADWAEDADERRALLARVAALEEDKLHDRASAITTWRDVLADQPADAGALNALERLYQGGEQWRELVDVLRRKLDHADPTEARQLLARIAEIHEVMLEEPDEAIAAHLETLDRSDGGHHDRRALGELGRLYREANRHADLLDVLERQAQTDEGTDRVARHVEIAQLLAGPLARPADALDRWATVLQQDYEHPAAIGAVESALDDPDLRLHAADILRPVYDVNDHAEKLAQLQTRAADWADEPAAKLRALGEVVRIREYRLGDKEGAFAAQLQALRHAATEPELGATLAETERLAGELGRTADLIDAYRGIAPDVLDADIQRRLHFDIADLSRAVRADHGLAAEYYQKVLDAQPDDRRALVALEAIYRDTNDDEKLVDVLLRQADVAGADVDDRVGAFVEAAGLYAQLGRRDDAIATWEQVLAIAPERRDAALALEQLYREQGRWPDVVDLYERRLGFATSVDEAVALQVQLGQIHEQHLRDVETALDNYAAALGGDPRNATALAAVERYLADPDARMVAAEVLEPIYVSQHRWADLIRVYTAKLESTSDPKDRLRITRFVARLYEEQLEDFEQASHWYARLFREAPSDAGIRDQLQRLAGVVGNWDFVATTYQQYLDDEQGESSDLRDVAIAAATIYDRRTNDISAAYAAYRRALSIPDDGVPDERELIRRLEELLGRGQRWADLVAVYDDVIGRSGDELRREALVKRARLLEDGLADPARAIDGWREVVIATEDGSEKGDQHVYREAVGELERLYRERGQWHDLVDLFEARLGRAQAPSDSAPLRLALAEVHEQQLKDVPSALDQYERTIAEGAGWDHAVSALERLVQHEQHRERIAELLEPVYRDQDWWQRLVVILDAKLAFMRDPHDQVTVLHEIAQLHEQRGGALDLALAALARAWRMDVADDDSLKKLLALATKLRAWDSVTQTLEEGAASTHDSELASSLWARAAEIHEVQRQDLPRAITAWRKVEEQHPDDLTALAALDRLLAQEHRVQELVIVVARRADLTDDAGVRLVLLHRVAGLYEEVLGDKPAAIVAYRRVLEVDDTDLSALDALERLYLETGDGRELAATVERKIELTTDLVARQGLRHMAAQVYEQQLRDVYQAIGQLTAILDDDPAEVQALAELDRLYAKEKLWPELLDVIDRRSQLAISAQDRAELAFRAAHLVETELRDPDAAIPRHGAVLQVSSAHAGSRAALEVLMRQEHHVDAVAPILERVYRAESSADGLVRVYEQRIAVHARGGDARGDWQALAEVHELLGNSPERAFATWVRALKHSPDDASLLAPLLRLAERTPALWAQLATELDALLSGAGGLSPDTEETYAMRLGQIAEDKLGNLEAAAAAYDRASHGADPRPALASLERVLARANQWQPLSAVLRRQADAAESDAQVTEYLYRLGDLSESTLDDAPAAIAAYREALSVTAAHAGSRSALERMLARSPEHAHDIVEVLEPLFEQDGDAARLSTVLEARLVITHDALDRANLLGRLVELYEGSLGDRARALDATLRWLAVDPASAHALGEVERLGEKLGAWHDVAARVSEIAHAPDAGARDAEPQVALLAFLGKVQRERLKDLDAAAAAYRAALALEPEALGVLDELILVLRARGDAAALAAALRDRGHLVADLREKRAAFAEVAALSERGGDRAGALAAWREVVDADETDREALDQLARLHRAGGDTADLIDVLGRAARMASSPDDEKALRVEIAKLEGTGPRAIAAWQGVLDLDPDDLTALGALQTAHAAANDWLAVADVQQRRLGLACTTAEKVALHAELAKIAEEKRDAPDDAIAAWFAVLDLDNAHVPAYDELERLLGKGERWHDLVEVLERRAELHGTLGDTSAEIATLARAADVWEAKLDDPDAAGEILEKILAREPTSVPALTRLSKIYARANDWDKAKRALEQALALNPTGRDAADLFFRLGEVARADGGDTDTAVLHFREALKHDPAHAAAITALEALARDRKDNALLADMLDRRASAVHAPAERVALLVELSELERRAGRSEQALSALARARADLPDDARVLAPLADLYFATGRLDEAAPIYDQLAEDAKKARRMKDVARFRQRQGGILEARGDRPGALAAYEEALRVNPTDVTTMTGLGRLYFASADWEKARKIYQSLVLQNIDPDAGVTKGSVYWALGKIHLELGQPPKAKSMFQRGLELEPQNADLRAALAQLS
ncbi:MAG TPA: tetratricopeptide repeat protein [Kofleriaceae bacterium]|jgi:tetratricopeptide (TPR) repeat protein